MAQIDVPQFPEGLRGESLIQAAAKLAFSISNEDRNEAVRLMEEWIIADHKLLQRMVNTNLICRQGVDTIIRATRLRGRAAASQTDSARLDRIRIAAERDLKEFLGRPEMKRARPPAGTTPKGESEA